MKGKLMWSQQISVLAIPVAVYRTPSDNISVFIDELVEALVLLGKTFMSCKECAYNSSTNCFLSLRASKKLTHRRTRFSTFIIQQKLGRETYQCRISCGKFLKLMHHCCKKVLHDQNFSSKTVEKACDTLRNHQEKLAKVAFRNHSVRVSNKAPRKFNRII